jgi:hypothetical protein
MKKTAALVLLALLAGALYAEDIRVVVPYVGAVTSVYEDDANGLDVDGTGLMTGLYLQWINPQLFQANAFVYYAPDVIDAPVIGGHLVADYYVWSDPLGKLALGAGVEVLQPGVSTEAPGPTLIDVTPTITAPYVRAGHYFYFGTASNVLLSVFPWAGVEYDITRGDIKIDPPGPGSIEDTIEDETLFGIAGLNVSATIMHFIDLQAKYRLTFNEDDLLSTFDAMANVYFNRHWGVSYRFKYMQSTSGSTSYHIGGIAYVF